MISALRASASATIAGPAACARSRRVEDANAVGVADRDRLVELARSRSSRASGNRSVRARSSGTSSTFSAMIRARRSAASWHATSIAASDGWPGMTGTRRSRYSSASAGPSAGGAFSIARIGTCRKRRRYTVYPTRPSHHPPEPHPARERVLDDEHEERGACRDPAEDGEHRPRNSADDGGSDARGTESRRPAASRIRRRTSDAWATVKESVAPSE